MMIYHFCQKLLHFIFVGLITISSLVSVTTLKAQTTTGWNCKTLTLNYPYVESRYYLWINNDTQVVFKIGNNEAGDALGHEENEYEMYDVISDKVTIFKDITALATAIRKNLPAIPDMSTDPAATLLVFPSPDNKRVIFPKNGSLWYKNLATGVESDLGIQYAFPNLPPNNYLSPLNDLLAVFWDNKGKSVLFEDYLWSMDKNVSAWNIEEQNNNVQKILISDQSPWKEMQNNSFFGFTLEGASPDGRYTVISPAAVDYSSTPNSLLYDAQSQAVIPLPFEVGGTAMAWLNSYSFIAVNTPDVVVYDIHTEQTTPLLKVGRTAGNNNIYFQMSPDGHYTIRSLNVPDNTNGKVEVCKIPWPSDYAASPTPIPTTQPSATATPNGASVPGSNQIGG